MAINKFIWKPDTCQCVLTQSYNTDTDTISLDSFTTVCSAHTSIVGDSNRYSTMLTDVQRKNFVYGIALKTFTSLLTQTDIETGLPIAKTGTKYNWSYSGSGTTRVLTVSITGATLTTTNKTTWQTSCNTQFGSGKVVVQ